jgi:hypothetical protein
MTTYILVAFFVLGVSAVINGFDDFFNIGISQAYDKAFQDDNLFLMFILRPTVYCNVCMSSFWGVIGSLVFGIHEPLNIVAHCMIAAAIITGYNRFFDHA